MLQMAGIQHLIRQGGIIKDNTAESDGTGTGAIGQQVLLYRKIGDVVDWKKIDVNLSETDNPTTSNVNDSFWKTVEYKVSSYG